jgi:hypothetical protein
VAVLSQGLAALALLLALTGSAARAQDLALRPAWNADHLVAEALVQRALRLLGEQAQPDAATLTRAGVLLDAALGHAPDDVELLRWRAELAELAGDAQARQQAQRRIMQLTPDDDALQLRLMLGSLLTLQTLDERIAAVGRWLDNPASAGLSRPLRSRLASSAAAWALESGVAATASARLGESLSSDPTNRQAALLALDLAGRRELTAVQRLSLWITAVQAGPHDPGLRLQLADALRVAGLPALAATQMEAAQALGVTLSDDDRKAWQAKLESAPAAGDDAVAAGRAIDRWPMAIRQPRPRQQPWALLDVEVQPAGSRYLDPLLATVTLRNGAGVPLALGEGEAIPTQLVFYVTPRIDGVAQTTLPPVVVDLRRRLALKPAEAVTVTVPLHRSVLGAWLADRPWQSVSLSIQAVLDPVVLSGGAVGVSDRGALGGTKPADRRALLPTAANVEAWQREALSATTDPAVRLVSLARLWRLAVSPTGGQDAVGPWLAGQVASLPDDAVAWLLLQETDAAGPEALTAALRTRVEASGHGGVALAAASNPWLATLVEASLAKSADASVQRYLSAVRATGSTGE